MLSRLVSPEPPGARPGHARTMRLFVALLGAVHLVAFAQLLPQIAVLIGPAGLLPARESLRALRQGAGAGIYWDLPTIFWASSSERALLAALWIGVGLSVLVVAGVRVRACLVGLYVLYLSIVGAGRSFFAWQWDSILLESTVLALFLPLDRRRAPSPLAVGLLRLLVLRFYVGAGIAKLVAGDDAWWTGAAMRFFYETAPLPTPFGLRVAGLPASFHEATTFAVLLLEIAVPLFVLWGRRGRLVAFVSLSVLQVGIALTASFGFFNWIALVLHVVLLDDGHLTAVGPRRPANVVPGAPPGVWRARALGAAAALLVVASIVENVVDFSGGPDVGAALRPVRRLWAPWHLAHAYHLFGTVERQRVAVEVLGSADERLWRRWELRHFPHHPQRPPSWLGPYLPRLDFQWAFLTTRPPGGARDEQRRWLTRLLEKMAREPRSVAALFVMNPFPTQRPHAVRVQLVRYEIASARERRRSGAWWKRSVLPGAGSLWLPSRHHRPPI
jgi:hypothetical protein